MLHKYKARELALCLNLFDKEVMDHEGQPYLYLQKAPEEFFERITGLMPMHIPFL